MRIPIKYKQKKDWELCVGHDNWLRLIREGLQSNQLKDQSGGSNQNHSRIKIQNEPQTWGVYHQLNSNPIQNIGHYSCGKVHRNT